MAGGDLIGVARTLPVAWRAKLPAQWEVEYGAETSGVASLQAALHRDGETVGILALAMYARDTATHAHLVAEPYLEALADGGLFVEDDDFAPEEAAAPWERSWLLKSSVTRSQSLPGMVLCRVLRHPQAWALAGVLSPRPEDDPDAWTENQRALDVVTSTLKIKG